MGKLDLKDRKILYQLDLNSRQTLTQLGKKVGLGRNVVAYRIKKMQDTGIIKNFYTNINCFKFGYMIFRIYIRFQYTPSKTKNEIINHFINYKNSMAVNSVKGDIDLSVLLWVKKDHEFYEFWNNTINKYGEYFDEKILSIYVQGDEYQYSFLLPEKNITNQRKKFSTIKDKPIEIDEIDYKILDILAVNARIPLIELANKVGCSSQTLEHRLKALKQKKVIIGFRAELDFSKLGLRWCDLKINLKKHSERKKIVQYMEKNPNFVCLDTAVGYKDLEMEFIIENFDRLDEIIDEIEEKFPNAIRNYVYWSDVKRHKYRFLPELNFK